MAKKDFHLSITTNVSASEAFKKIAKVGDWWLTSFTGKAAKLNDVFKVILGDHGYVNFKIVEVIPVKKIVWLVTDSILSHYKDETEWNNTKMVFELSDVKGKAKIDFTHVGLVKGMECYSDCEWGWNHYIGESLPKLITTGKGIPYDDRIKIKEVKNIFNQKQLQNEKQKFSQIN